VLRVRDLRVCYGRVVAVHQVSLALEAGRIAAVVGANGAGKTTLLKCLLDLCAADDGRVEIFGLENTRAASRARLIRAKVISALDHFVSAGLLIKGFK